MLIHRNPIYNGGILIVLLTACHDKYPTSEKVSGMFLERTFHCQQYNQLKLSYLWGVTCNKDEQINERMVCMQ